MDTTQTLTSLYHFSLHIRPSPFAVLSAHSTGTNLHILLLVSYSLPLSRQLIAVIFLYMFSPKVGKLKVRTLFQKCCILYDF